MNEFDSRAEQASIQGQYAPVECKCGWRGTQSQLLLKPASKNRECPACKADFTRVGLNSSAEL